MSYASFTKSFPDLLKNIPQKLGQPTGIAVLASIGIHAVLGASLPYLPLASNEKPKPVRNVQLLELGKNELDRLPPPPLQTLPLPPSLNEQLQPLSPLPSSLTAPLPPLPSKGSSLYDLTAPLKPLSPLDLDLKSPLGKSNRKLPDLSKLRITDSPLRNDLKAKQTQEPPLPSELFNTQPKTSTNPQFQIATGSKIPTSAIMRDRRGLPGGLSPAPLEEPPLPGASNPSPASLLQPLTDPASPLAANPGPQPLFPKGTPPLTTSPTGTIQGAVPNQGNLTGGTTSNDSVLAGNLQEWSERNQVTSSSPQYVRISRNYPSTARAAGQPNGGAVLVAVKVDTNGKVISDTLEVKGSSFSDGAFDQEAISAVRGYVFPATGKEQAYFVQVQFRNDSRSPEILTSPTQNERPGTAKPETPAKPESSIERQTPLRLQNTPQSETPAKPESSTERQTPLRLQNPPQPETPVKPDNSTDRQTLPRLQSAPQPESLVKPESSTERQTLPNPPRVPKVESSTERQTLPNSRNLPKLEDSTERQTLPNPPNVSTPDNSTQRQNSTKPQESTKPETSTESSAENLVEKLRQNFSESPRSESMEAPKPTSTEKPSSDSMEKPSSDSNEE